MSEFYYFNPTLTLEGINSGIIINPNLDDVFATNNSLNVSIRLEFDRATRQWLNCVMNKIIKTVVSATLFIINFDFERCPNENVTRLAAYHLLRFCAGNYIQMKFRAEFGEIAAQYLFNQLVNVFGVPETEEDFEKIRLIEATLINDNIGFICATVQKMLTEISLVELDKKLREEFKEKIKSKTIGDFFHSNVLDIVPGIRCQLVFQPTRLPLPYSLFIGSIPGFLPIINPFERDLLLPKTSFVYDSQDMVAQPQQSIGIQQLNMFTNMMPISVEFMNLIDEMMVDCELFLQFHGIIPETNILLILLVKQLNEALGRAKCQGRYVWVDLISLFVRNWNLAYIFVPSDTSLAIFHFYHLHIIIANKLKSPRAFGNTYFQEFLTNLVNVMKIDDIEFSDQHLSLLFFEPENF